jgi:hypothetical protein
VKISASHYSKEHDKERKIKSGRKSLGEVNGVIHEEIIEDEDEEYSWDPDFD